MLSTRSASAAPISCDHSSFNLHATILLYSPPFTPTGLRSSYSYLFPILRVSPVHSPQNAAPVSKTGPRFCAAPGDDDGSFVSGQSDTSFITEATFISSFNSDTTNSGEEEEETPSTLMPLTPENLKRLNTGFGGGGGGSGGGRDWGLERRAPGGGRAVENPLAPAISKHVACIDCGRICPTMVTPHGQLCKKCFTSRCSQEAGAGAGAGGDGRGGGRGESGGGAGVGGQQQQPPENDPDGARRLVPEPSTDTAAATTFNPVKGDFAIRKGERVQVVAIDRGVHGESWSFRHTWAYTVALPNGREVGTELSKLTRLPEVTDGRGQGHAASKGHDRTMVGNGAGGGAKGVKRSLELELGSKAATSHVRGGGGDTHARHNRSPPRSLGVSKVQREADRTDRVKGKREKKEAAAAAAAKETVAAHQRKLNRMAFMTRTASQYHLQQEDKVENERQRLQEESWSPPSARHSPSSPSSPSPRRGVRGGEAEAGGGGVAAITISSPHLGEDFGQYGSPEVRKAVKEKMEKRRKAEREESEDDGDGGGRRRKGRGKGGKKKNVINSFGDSFDSTEHDQRAKGRCCVMQ